MRSDQLVERIPAPLPARQADGAVDPGGCPIEGRHGDLEQKASQGSAVALCIDPGGHGLDSIALSPDRSEPRGPRCRDDQHFHSTLRALPRPLLESLTSAFRKLSREDALKLWGDKRQQGWQPCPRQWRPLAPLSQR